jgi:hypothetical protein
MTITIERRWLMADWQSIKTEYITTDTSYRKLAQKYGVSYVQIGNVGKQENWVELRRQHLDKTFTKTVDKISNKKADKMSRIDDLADKLLEKLEQAITELDMQLYKHTDKTKVIEYNYELVPGKPTKETVHEEEKLLEVKSIVDRQGLKQIASALKDIKEVKMLRSELDKQEQEARIDKLRKEAMVEKENNEVKVTMQGELEEYSE